MVASATRSRCGVTSTPSASASFATTPVPQSSGNGYSDGRVATTGQSGSSSPGRWWSVTTTSRPSAFASATSFTAVIPQSTVTTRRAALVREARDRGGADAVALVEPARQMPVDLRAEASEREHGQGRGADPVDVVVAVDADPLAPLDREPDACDRLLHVAEAERIVARGIRREERACRVGVAVPAADEDGCGHLVEPELGHQALHLAVRARTKRPAALHCATTLRGPSDDMAPDAPAGDGSRRAKPGSADASRR